MAWLKIFILVATNMAGNCPKHDTTGCEDIVKIFSLIKNVQKVVLLTSVCFMCLTGNVG